MKKHTDERLKSDDDLSENSRNLALKDMERSRERLLLTQKIAGIGSFEYLPEERLIILSPEASSVLGLNPEKTVYRLDEFCKRMTHGKYDGFCELLEHAYKQDVPENIEFIIKDDNRENRYIEVFMDDPGGTLQGSIVGAFHNITKRKQAEISRNTKAEAFDTVFYNAKVAILILNLKGYIIDYNNSALNLFGYTDEEMKKIHSRQLLREDDVKDASKIFASFINSAGKLNFLEYRLVKKGGEVFDVLANFEMIVGSEGEKIYVFINDISEIKEMERKGLDQERMLIQQSKMATLGEMVALIAHQWQQPINSIAMIVQMLEELIEVDEANRKMLQKSVDSVMAQVSFMANTMNDFRNFLKPSDVKSVFNVHRIVKEVISLYIPQLKHYNINCNLFLDHDSVKRAQVFGYENELKNVLLNFLTNSRDAIETNCPTKGEIQIVLSEDDEKVYICIEDNGGGVSDDVLEKLFNPYVSTKGEKGTGLGLYMSKLIVKDRMGGDIMLSNLENGLKICVVLTKTD